MYNLLMISSRTNDEWEQNEGRVFDVSFFRDREDRIFEHTDESIKQKFTGIDGPDFDALMKFPCLFTYEGFRVTGSIGQISKVQSSNGIFQIVYSLPSIYPKIVMNEDSTFDALGIGRHEKGRTHWAVKNIDLFEAVTRLLYRADNLLTDT